MQQRRTRAASQIEKATLDASRYGHTQKREYARPAAQQSEAPQTIGSLNEDRRPIAVIATDASNAETCSILDPEKIYTMYNTVPSIKEKDAFVVELTKSVFDPTFTTEGEGNIQKLVHDLIGYYVIMEGIFFYAGFAIMLALKRRHKMVGIGEQFEYIMRDESLHLAFGCDLINTVKKENSDIWTKELQADSTRLVEEAVALEKLYARDACPEGILGINSSRFCDYVEYIVDRRLERIELPKVYRTENPFPWMSLATLCRSWERGSRYPRRTSRRPGEISRSTDRSTE